MYDAKLLFCEAKDIKGAATETDVVDLGQVSPDLGMTDCPALGVTVQMTKAWAGGTTPKVTFEVQHADDNGGPYDEQTQCQRHIETLASEKFHELGTGRIRFHIF